MRSILLALTLLLPPALLGQPSSTPWNEVGATNQPTAAIQDREELIQWRGYPAARLLTLRGDGTTQEDLYFRSKGRVQVGERSFNIDAFEIVSFVDGKYAGMQIVDVPSHMQDLPVWVPAESGDTKCVLTRSIQVGWSDSELTDWISADRPLTSDEVKKNVPLASEGRFFNACGCQIYVGIQPAHSHPTANVRHSGRVKEIFEVCGRPELREDVPSVADRGRLTQMQVSRALAELRVGDSIGRVDELLGSPEFAHETDKGVKVWRYIDGSDYFLVAFSDDRVAAFQREPRPNVHIRTFQVEVGMKQSEVQRLLGPPRSLRQAADKSTSGSVQWVYEIPGKQYVVEFAAGVVSSIDYEPDSSRQAPTRIETAGVHSASIAVDPKLAATHPAPAVASTVTPKSERTTEEKVSDFLDGLVSAMEAYEAGRRASQASREARPAPIIVSGGGAVQNSKSNINDAKKCSYDSQCGFGNVCVKPAGTIGLQGVCVTPVDRFGNKVWTVTPSTTTRTVSSCTFDTQCGLGFRCEKGRGQIRGLCVKK